MNKPLSGLTWLYPHKGHGRAPAEHLRELLMACGVLPAIDKQICGFERWLIGHLATITDPDHAQVVRRFTTWHLLPRLRAKAERKPITPPIRRFARDQTRQATRFLEWLAAQGLTLASCGQSDIDLWHAEHGAHHRGCLRSFLLWCIDNKLTRRFHLPTTEPRRATPMPPQDRIELLGRILTAEDQPLRSRTAAVIAFCSTPNHSPASSGSPSTTSSVTTTRCCCDSANLRPRSRNRPPTSCWPG
ncbi:hypothetical protein [Nocardia australiensis]|uniref:hypothetical protein n=1 Tax=Nocardia australiensis TaxID=2887191 RepID=UPI001D15A180|nr:hypothetical protein [Nocardia australiensis]